ncbi:MAG: trigger factor [Bacteroides sp.]|nr:trigger factor [Eubacterium sp.]MCM1418979.1 trigger factor [Roseburia sp.]MCM1463127.1 trigger factor [Bacteroides sp.]
MEIISNNKTETNTVEAEIRADAAEFEAAVQSVFLKRRKNIAVPGFRRGKATRRMIEARYGENVFYEEAVNGMYQKTVADAAEELNLAVVDVPDVEVTEISKENGVTFKVQYTVKPEVKISDYKGLKLEKKVKTVSDEDVDKEIDRVRNNNARIIDVTDRAAQTGDTVILDYEGSVDGVPFDGGKAEGFSLELGSGRFIPGFEDQIVGKSVDEDFDVSVSFPEDYHAAELAGKPAVFKCKLHEIKTKELAELDDEFVKDVSEFDTLDEYKADIKKKLTDAANERADSALDDSMAEKLAEMLEAEVPPVMYEHRIADMLREWEYRNRYIGITLNDYLKYTGQTAEQFRESFRAPAEIQVKLRLALEKIAEIEGIEATDEEREQHYQELSEQHKMDIERVKAAVPAETLMVDLKIQKAFDFVKESAEITEVEETDSEDK